MSKNIVTPELIKLTAEQLTCSFAARLKEENLASRCDIANFVKKDRF